MLALARRALGICLGLLVRVWVATLRVQTVMHPDLHDAREKPWVLCLWHGQIFALLGHRRRRRTVALVSLSKDGAVLAASLRLFGLAVVRGSSSRAGRVGLAQMVARLQRAHDGAFALDGPRGPSKTVHYGAIAAAQRSGGVLVPYVAACGRAHYLATWDQFAIPLPFSRVAVVLGAPMNPANCLTDDVPTALAEALDNASQIARFVVTRGARCGLTMQTYEEW